MKDNNLVNSLLELYHEHRFAHAYLFETNNINNCFNDILLLIKKMNCHNKYEDNCQRCTLCNLINQNTLPSLVVIEPEGTIIKKEAIETLKERFSNKPVYTENNIYIIKYPEKMNATAFNKLLKFLEEPEPGVLAFLITENKDKIASTIVSRCELIKQYYEENNEESIHNFNDLTSEYLSIIKEDLSKALVFNVGKLQISFEEKQDYISFFRALLDSLEKEGDFEKANIVVKYLQELDYNVNSSLMLDSFVVEMRNMYER